MGIAGTDVSGIEYGITDQRELIIAEELISESLSVIAVAAN